MEKALHIWKLSLHNQILLIWINYFKRLMRIKEKQAKIFLDSIAELGIGILS